ncbi:high mobility group box domain-containing protein, partial [Epithele typhae]|uniref:high mobility group box domain-containing protein n=1 Tax=Epithele typhae TaxID=378194 RepID=UPI0020082FBF
IPRPPNAFMLYRSHLLKTGKIPKEFEHRQQNISRVAGECWNMLSMDEKAVWHAEARNALELHKLRHPDYKFAP